MKKSVLLLFALVLVALACSSTVFAEDQISGAYMYRVSGGKAIITSFDNSVSGSLVIPERLNGYSVYAIDESVFAGCSTITEIKLPSQLVSIGEDAFRDCTALKSVTFSQVLSEIGNKAFYNCKKLEEALLPETVVTVGDQAFYGCESIKTVTLGSRVTEIGAGAFRKCKALQTVTLPEGMTALEENTFYGCESLAEMILPESVTQIGNGAFRECKALRSLSLHEGIIAIGKEAFYGCSAIEDFSFPESLSSVGQSAFVGTGWLSSQPDGVVYVGKVAYGFRGLAPIILTLREGTVAVSDGAFASVSGIEKLRLPSTLATLGDRAFAFSAQLREVVLPKGVLSVGENAFYQCASLTSVYYEGTERDKAKLSFGGGNEALLSAEWQNDSCIKNHGTYLHDYEQEAFCSFCGAEKVLYLAGDLDGDGEVRAADAIYLLYHTLLGGERYPVTQPCDYDCDGAVRASDAIYLLYHTLLGGERYPLSSIA